MVKQWSPFPNIRWSSLGKKKVMCFVVQTRELWPIGQSYHEAFLSSIDFLQAVSTLLLDIRKLRLVNTEQLSKEYRYPHLVVGWIRYNSRHQM